jgi:hypothetical protein
MLGKIIIRKILLLFLLSSTFSAVAEEEVDQLSITVFDNISSSYIECVAYNTILEQALRNSNKDDLADQYKTINVVTLSNATELSLMIRSEEMTEKVIASRAKMYFDSMMEEIDNHFSNFSILMNKYAVQCKYMVENSKEYMDKESKRLIEKYNNQ